MGTKVRLNPAVRIIPPSAVTGSRWTVENILEKRRYTLSRRAIAALVASCRPQEPHALAKRMMEIAGDADQPDAHWDQVIESLRGHGLIITTSLLDSDPDLAWLVRLRKNWSRFGWHEAVEYHTLTFDYPCLDYSVGATILADQGRMRGYQATEADEDRYKLDYCGYAGIHLPEPSANIPAATARAMWQAEPAPSSVDAEALSTVVSLAFGATGTIVPRTRSAPLLRRSSPSGGARHPSEGYVIVRDVAGLERGWYHVTMRPFSLQKVGDHPIDDEALQRLFPQSVERFPNPIKALIVVTSVFERNMYRYREPRTFRTVHMDAGHIAGTIRLSARSLGLAAGISYGDDAGQIESLLDIDGMHEGYMLTVALADGTSSGSA